MDSPNPNLTLLFLLSASSLFLSFAKTQPYHTLTAYEMLEKFNFPKGILPEGVESYLLRKDGSFDAYLGADCEFKVKGNHLLRYKKKISGEVETGRLKNLKGVSIKVLFLWIGISEVVRKGDELRFYIGPFSESYSVSSFVFCPQCRSGFSFLNQLNLDS